MPHFENIIRDRVYSVLSTLLELFEDKVRHSPVDLLDINEILYTHEFAVTLSLLDGSKIECYEKYRLEEFQLVIDYYYAFKNVAGKTLVSFDNTPHHPTISSFPHHKHLYPKHRYKPLWFSGTVYDAMSEILWIIERRD